MIVQSAICKNFVRAGLSLLMAALVFGCGSVRSSWAKDVQGDCFGDQPKGASWIHWSGYAPWDWGEGQHYLHWWNGRYWEVFAYSEDILYGSANTTLARSSAGYRSGLWMVVASYSASFVVVPPATFYFHCP